MLFIIFFLKKKHYGCNSKTGQLWVGGFLTIWYLEKRMGVNCFRFRIIHPWTVNFSWRVIFVVKLQASFDLLHCLPFLMWNMRSVVVYFHLLLWAWAAAPVVNRSIKALQKVICKNSSKQSIVNIFCHRLVPGIVSHCKVRGHFLFWLQNRIALLTQHFLLIWVELNKF